MNWNARMVLLSGFIMFQRIQSYHKRELHHHKADGVRCTCNNINRWSFAASTPHMLSVYRPGLLCAWASSIKPLALNHRLDCIITSPTLSHVNLLLRRALTTRLARRMAPQKQNRPESRFTHSLVHEPQENIYIHVHTSRALDTVWRHAKGVDRSAQLLRLFSVAIHSSIYITHKSDIYFKWKDSHKLNHEPFIKHSFYLFDHPQTTQHTQSFFMAAKCTHTFLVQSDVDVLLTSIHISNKSRQYFQSYGT